MARQLGVARQSSTRQPSTARAGIAAVASIAASAPAMQPRAVCFMVGIDETTRGVPGNFTRWAPVGFGSTVHCVFMCRLAARRRQRVRGLDARWRVMAKL
jgi:hypothetical protein